MPRILLIENDALDLDDAMKALGRFHCKVDVHLGCTPCDISYWKTLSADRLPNVVIVNLHVTPYSCINILHDLRSVERTKDIPVVVLTNSLVEKHVLESFRFGRYTCVVKPVSYVKLLYAVTTLGVHEQFTGAPKFPTLPGI